MDLCDIFRSVHSNSIVAISATQQAGTLDPGMESDDKMPRHGAVLVADDSTLNRKLLISALKKSCPTTEWRIREAGSSEEVLRVAIDEGTAFDLMFMDEHFSEESILGSDATKRLRAHGLDHPIIIALTSDQDTSSIQRIFQSGVDAYWTKPFPSCVDGTFHRKLADLFGARMERPESDMSTDEASFRSRGEVFAEQ